MKKTNLKVGGMHCASCSAVVSRSLSKIEGVESANVNLTTNKATITHDDNLKVQTLIDAVKKKGYEAQNIEEDETEESSKLVEKEKDLEIIKLKKRFFISLLLALPVFILGMFFMQNPIPYQNFIMLAFTTPVQFYVALPMYKSAVSALKGWNANMDTLIVLGTSAAYFYSIYVLIVGKGHVYFEASSVLITIVIFGRLLEAKAKSRTNESIKLLVGLKPKEAFIERQGKEIKIKVDDIQKGDIIIIKPGSKIPVDGEIISGHSSIDESMITGESIPVEKTKDEIVIGGTINKQGSFRFKATKIGKDTTLSHIIKLIQDAQQRKAPIQRFADTVSAYFVPAVLVIALSTFLVWYFIIQMGFSFSLIAGVSVLVIACPCSLGLATPTAIMVGTGKGAKNGILIKGGEILERAEKIKYVIFDKTGTITKGVPEVTDIIALEKNEKEILRISASIEKDSEHPLAEAIVKKSKDKKIKLGKTSKFLAIPGRGVMAVLSGKNYLFGNPDLMKEKKVKISNANKINDLEKQGKTVMVIAENKKMIGVIAVADKIKESSKKAVKDLIEMGIEPYMITGDNERTANAVGEIAGIKNVFAGIMPDEKANYVKKLQKKGIIAMVGDGINDAPALAQSDIGIAMSSGTDVAMETGDIVLMKNDLKDVARSIKLSKMTMNKIKQNMFWALFYNSLGIPIAAGLLYPWTGWLLNPVIAGTAMAMSSVSVVSNSLLLKAKKL